MMLRSCVCAGLLALTAVAALVAASPLPDANAVAAEAAETYDALQLADSDSAMDERDEMAEEGERELTEHEAMRFAHELDAIEESGEDSSEDGDDAVGEDEVEVDVEQAADAEIDAEAGEDLELMELDATFAARQRFGPFQAAANVMPYNMAVDPGHNFMNPFIRGYNPAYDGYTPQPGGMHWNVSQTHHTHYHTLHTFTELQDTTMQCILHYCTAHQCTTRDTCSPAAHCSPPFALSPEPERPELVPVPLVRSGQLLVGVPPAVCVALRGAGHVSRPGNAPVLRSQLLWRS